MSRLAALCCSCWIVLATTVSIAHAANDTWAVPANGFWLNRAPLPFPNPPFIINVNTWWSSLAPPGPGDAAVFSIPGTYTATIDGATAAFQALTVATADVTFVSSGGIRTLNVNSASGGQDLSLSGGANLTLGTAAATAVNLAVGDDLNVQGSSVIIAQFGSDITAADLSGSGLNGQITMDGPGSTLMLTGAAANNFVGRNDTDAGFLVFGNGTTGNSIAGNLGIADSPTANATGFLLLADDSTLSLNGNLNLANQNVAGQNATIDIYGDSILNQNGASAITVGSAANGTAAIKIGTTADRGTLRTGTGTMTINATGTVTIGSVANFGRLFALGDVTINGGTLTRGDDDAVFDLASGRTLTIQNGGEANFTGFYDTKDGATYLVTGAGSAWTNTGGLNVGFDGTGTLSIEAGGSVSNSNGIIGYNTGSTGTVTVTGSGSTWTNSAQLFVGRIGTGTLSIEAGGSVSNSNGIIGLNTGSTGTVTVTGAGSSWNSVGSVYVGGNADSAGGMGTLTVETGGTVNIGSELKLWDDGTVNLSGGTINVQSLASSGGTFNFNSGTLAITGPAGLVIGSSGPLGSSLALIANQTLSVVNTTTIDAGSTLTLNGGTLNTASLAGGGAIVLHAGTLNLMSANLTVGAGSVFGSTLFLGSAMTVNITNQATIEAGAEMVVADSFSSSSLTNNGDLVAIDATIGGPVVNNNATTVVGTVDFNGLVSGPGDFFGPGTANFNGGMAPGASPAEIAFEGSIALSGTNTLFIEIGGIALGTQYDSLTIAGSAALDGILDVSLISGFAPAAGQQFTVLSADSIVNNGLVLGSAAAGSFNLLVSSSSVILQAIGPGLAGDYNLDGVVNAADYTVWRDNLGSNTSLPNDDTAGVGPDDYERWKLHFGDSLGSGSAGASPSQTAVPEPSCLALVAGCFFFMRRRTRTAG